METELPEEIATRKDAAATWCAELRDRPCTELTSTAVEATGQTAARLASALHAT